MLVHDQAFSVVESSGDIPPFQINDNSGSVEEHVSAFLRDLIASDRSPATVKTYTFALCAWLNFLHSCGKPWQSATQEELRDYVLFLRSAENPYRLRHRPGGPEPGTSTRAPASPALPPATSLRQSTTASASSTASIVFSSSSPKIKLSLSASLTDAATPTTTRLNPGPSTGAGLYRQRQPKRVPRAITDELWAEVFDSLQHDRDRAILCLFVSSGSRAQELLTMKGADVDWGQQRVRLICKGTRDESWVAASPEFFRWLAAYLTERSPLMPNSPLWVTLRSPERPLGYTALRAILTRVNEKLGTNITAHDFRHTCASRLASDPGVSLVDIQTHLRHRHITTTEAYLVTRAGKVKRRDWKRCWCTLR